MATGKVDAADAPLKRLGGGRWQTRDERFTIEPQSGTWVVVDAEQTDELGLPLVRGPFGSLGDAKAAIATARSSGPVSSPLTARAGDHPERASDEAEHAEASGGARRTATGRRSRTEAQPDAPADAGRASRGADEASPERVSRDSRRRSTRPKSASRATAEPQTPAEPAEPAEPRWLRDLEPDDRRRARRWLDRLTEDGARDAEGLVRRDVVGDVAAVAAWAIRRRLEELGPDASPDQLAAMLGDGRDERLGVRWHLVDADGRRIHLDVDERG